LTYPSCAATFGGTSFSCNLGPLPAGGSATVTVTVLVSPGVTGNLTGAFSVSAFDSSGAALPDLVPGNNLGSAITGVIPAINADIQLVGSAQNGGPTAPATDTITWQIKNATGNQSVPGLQFTSSTASANLTFTAVSSPQGTCSLTGPKSLSCSASTLAGGQTMLVTVTVNISAAGTAVASGSALFNGIDTQPSNNNSSVTISAK
jgi:uncharacterized protein DUF11